MTDEELVRLGRAVILGGDVPTTATPEEIRRGVELAIDEMSRRLAPFGYKVRPITDESASEYDKRTFREFVVLFAMAIGTVLLIAVVVGGGMALFNAAQ